MPTPDARRRRGILFLFLSALGFSASLILANMTLQAGASPLTINMVRFAVACCLVFAYLKLTGRAVFAPGTLAPAFVLGCLALGLSLSYVSSTQYIPVSLAVLIFYINPFLVALAARVFDKTSLTSGHVMTMTLAFLGLGLALEIWKAFSLDWRGIGLASLTALCATTMFIVSNRALRKAPSQTLSFQALTVAAVVAVLVTALTGGPAWPQTADGWIWLTLAGACYALGQTFLYGGIALAGPVQGSQVMNLEPVFTIALAVLLLGDRLSPAQAVGAGLVIVAVYAVSRPKRPAPIA